MATSETLQQCVNEGAALLDTSCPGWEKFVRPDILNLHNGYNCILGQVFGSFSKGTAVLFGPDTSIYNLSLMTSQHGFLVSMAQVDLELGNLGLERAYGTLTDLWIARVRKAAQR